MKKRYNQITSINPKVGRNINRAIILNAIREKQPISRTKISEITGLNKSTVSNIVTTLLGEDLVREEVAKNREVGRNPVDLSIKREKNFVGAIYIDSVDTMLAIVDIDGTIVKKVTVKTESANPRTFIPACLDTLKKMHSNHTTFLKQIGISIAGIVDSAHSRVVYSSNLGWQDIDVGSIIQENNPEIEIVTVENDAKASALAELVLGRHKIPSSNFIFLSIGPGIGAGIVIDNHILSGNSHAAGEYGHMTLVEGGEPCTCGNKGCWEVYASDRATMRYFSRLTSQRDSNVDTESLIDRALEGDKNAVEAFRKSAEYLGLGIAGIIRTIDPQSIIIGGSIVRAWKIIYPVIMDTVYQRGFFGKQRNTLILPTSLTDSPPLLGAAALSIRKIFTDYRIVL
ncbi:MAG TPA: ROK family transcriptional regulator [Bacteroidota bacterium]|nr:ROK family transcriptional regulator [Bacteroidota bacterium]